MNKFNLLKDTVIKSNGNALITKANNGPLDNMYQVKSTDSSDKNYNGIYWNFKYDLFPELNNVNNYLKFKFTLASNISQSLVVNLDYRDLNPTPLANVTAGILFLDAGETRDYEFNIPLTSVTTTHDTNIVPAIYNTSNNKVDFRIYNVSFEMVEGVNLNHNILTTLKQNIRNNEGFGTGVVKRIISQDEEIFKVNLIAGKQLKGAYWRFTKDQLQGFTTDTNDSVALIKFAMWGDFESKIQIQLIMQTDSGTVNKNLATVDVKKNKNYFSVPLPLTDLDGVRIIDLNVVRTETSTVETNLFFSEFSVNTYIEKTINQINQINRLPHVDLIGNTTSMSKDKAVTLQFKFTDNIRTISGYSVTKWQGDSSLYYPKKSYRIKLYSDPDTKTKLKVIPFAGWESDNKFNLKASYNDATFGRNLINSKLFAEITANRKNIDSNLAATDTFATVKGLPITVSINGSPAGLYTFNTTKDVYNMDDKNNNNIVIGSTNWCDATAFKTDTALLDGTDFEIIQNSGDNADTKAKFNRLMQFINSSTDTDFVANIDKYLSLTSVYDFMAFVMMIQGEDSLGKNMMFATWDGQKWHMTAYDLDTAWSMRYDGTALTDPSTNLFDFHGNKLFLRVSNLFKINFKNRYNQLRNSTMTASNIIEKFENWYLSIGQENFENDQAIWNAPSYKVTSLAQIRRDVPLRLSAVDDQISKL